MCVGQVGRDLRCVESAQREGRDLAAQRPQEHPMSATTMPETSAETTIPEPRHGTTTRDPDSGSTGVYPLGRVRLRQRALRFESRRRWGADDFDADRRAFGAGGVTKADRTRRRARVRRFHRGRVHRRRGGRRVPRALRPRDRRRRPVDDRVRLTVGHPLHRAVRPRIGPPPVLVLTAVQADQPAADDDVGNRVRSHGPSKRDRRRDRHPPRQPDLQLGEPIALVVWAVKRTTAVSDTAEARS